MTVDAGLRARLGALVRDAGRSAAEPASAALAWAADIASLREAQRVRERRRRDAEDALPGEPVAPGVRVVRWLEPYARVGPDARSAALAPPCVPLSVPPWEAAGPAHGELLFVDTETTGLAGGTGTLVFLLGLARFAPEGLAVEQWLLLGPGAERDWLDAIAATLPEDPLLVSFNGKAFDLPLLAARHRMQHKRDPFANRAHWDLLFPLRRAFARSWPDCRLQTAEKRLLAIERVDDLPGSFAPAAYHAFLRQGDATLLRQVVAHNRDDVVSLARLLPALEHVFARPRDYDADVRAIAARLRHAGRVDDALATLAAHGGDREVRRAFALELKRRRRFDEAERELEPLALADRPCAVALEALAKIAEHVRADFSRALSLSQQLLQLEPAVARHGVRVRRLQARSVRGFVPAGP